MKEYLDIKEGSMNYSTIILIILFAILMFLMHRGGGGMGCCGGHPQEKKEPGKTGQKDEKDNHGGCHHG